MRADTGRRRRVPPSSASVRLLVGPALCLRWGHGDIIRRSGRAGAGAGRAVCRPGVGASGAGGRCAPYNCRPPLADRRAPTGYRHSSSAGPATTVSMGVGPRRRPPTSPIPGSCCATTSAISVTRNRPSRCPARSPPFSPDLRSTPRHGPTGRAGFLRLGDAEASAGPAGGEAAWGHAPAHRAGHSVTMK